MLLFLIEPLAFLEVALEVFAKRSRENKGLEILLMRARGCWFTFVNSRSWAVLWFNLVVSIG